MRKKCSTTSQVEIRVTQNRHYLNLTLLLVWLVKQLVSMVHRLVSTYRAPRKVWLAAWRAMTADLWNLRSVLKYWGILWYRRWKGRLHFFNQTLNIFKFIALVGLVMVKHRFLFTNWPMRKVVVIIWRIKKICGIGIIYKQDQRSIAGPSEFQ